ncbi:hypothetical protein ASE35_01055 [Lysobacter sp. Root916]|uniref:LIC_13387 family protein n=1 Tax=Lysobacter sp. Root916 TaxID=1736606 RepID=UPI00070CE7AE|nr:hypothetical protein [Lysobacter sp. Root916]KRD38993.1 hypothetical protein ASE35_01055 [Lysobacter sp. Root916]
MIATLLLVVSAAVLLTLGTAHLIITFVGPKLRPRDRALEARMREVSPGITRKASMWDFWVGFNISHSLAAILYGLIYGYLAIAHRELLFSSAYLLTVGALMLGTLFVVAKIYWFRAPLIGIAISLLCYLAGVAVALS